MEFQMLMKYPLILPADSSSSKYKGYLCVNGFDYHILLQVPSDDYEGYELKMTPQLQPFKKEINMLIEHGDSYSIVEFLDKLKNILASKTQPLELVNLSNSYRHVINEFVELREFYFNIHKCILAKDLSNIYIVYIDSSSRNHDIKVNIDFNDTNNIFNISQSSIPNSVNKDSLKSSNSLKDLYEAFSNAVERLQHFFDLMENIDELCWVLDPTESTRKEIYRRIVLGENCSVIVTIDPLVPTNPPHLKFLGPERMTDKFTEKVSSNLENWDRNGDFLQELLKLLEIDSFPENSVKKNDEIVLYNSDECCICFSSKMNDKLPEIICLNSSCEKYFHQECLYQWLTSVNCRKILNEIQGNCPNCEKRISCPAY